MGLPWVSTAKDKISRRFFYRLLSRLNCPWRVRLIIINNWLRTLTRLIFILKQTFDYELLSVTKHRPFPISLVPKPFFWMEGKLGGKSVECLTRPNPSIRSTPFDLSIISLSLVFWQSRRGESTCRGVAPAKPISFAVTNSLKCIDTVRRCGF